MDKKHDKEMNSRASISLSKTRICKGLNCIKSLYLEVKKKSLATPVTVGQQAIFDQGHAVGRKAQERYPDGVLIDVPYYEPDRAIAATKEAIENGALTIFEGAFRFDSILIRADILSRQTVDAPWKLYEVKSTSSLKEEHLPDVAVQAYVLDGAGIKVDHHYLTHLNRECTYPDLSDLFTYVLLTTEIEDQRKHMEEVVQSFKKMLSEATEPIVDIGPYCDAPYECSFKSHCWKSIPTPSVFDIPRLKTGRKWTFFKDGIVAFNDKRLTNLNEIQERVVSCSVRGSRWVHKSGIKEALNELAYPISYLDFETIAPAIPRFEGCRPYSPNVPFQFVVYVEREAGVEPKCVEYLHKDQSDPRPGLIQALVEAIPSEGSVVAYNKGFEAGCLRKLAEFSSSDAKQLLDIEGRLWDPLPIIQNNVYDPAFGGSFSIKKVAPALLGQEASYSNMAIGEGTEAQVAFEKIIASETLPADKTKIESSLIEYCKKDTYLMVELKRWLQMQVSPQGKAL